MTNVVSGCSWKGCWGGVDDDDDDGLSASKSSCSRPSGRVGGQRRWRLGVDGLLILLVLVEVVVDVTFSWSQSGPMSSDKARGRLRWDVRGVAFLTVCGFFLRRGAWPGEVNLMGLSRRDGALVCVFDGSEDWISDWSARQLLRIAVGDGQDVGGGERIRLMIVLVDGRCISHEMGELRSIFVRCGGGCVSGDCCENRGPPLQRSECAGSNGSARYQTITL